MAKAEAAEQKAQGAKDNLASEQAWRDAARQWERAAERETSETRRHQYSEKAQAARANAENPPALEDHLDAAFAPKVKPFMVN